MKLKALLMKDNITHVWLKTKRALHEENHLSAWLKGQTQPTNAHSWICSLSLQLHQFFPFKHEVTLRGFTSLCCWNAKPINVTARAAKYEDKSLYFILNFILLSTFYSLPFYRWMQVILISSHYLMNMISLTLP